MADNANGSAPVHRPYVPEAEGNKMPEFTLRALILGLFMCVLLGAANAYLGLKAGMTIAATYPAAVIGMALLRIVKGSILEENIARTVGSIGESIAAGAIFTIPAFLIAGIWTSENFASKGYLVSSIIMFLGGLLGIFFVTMLRRVMVDDKELPFPESIAAAEIHKSGRAGGSGAVYLGTAMALGAFIQVLKTVKLFASKWQSFIYFGEYPLTFQKKDGGVTWVNKTGDLSPALKGGGGILASSPAISPAYLGVGYIIGPTLAALNFSGGLLAWGLFVPLLLSVMGPELMSQFLPQGVPTEGNWSEMASNVWAYMVRPIAIGGMLVSAVYTLYKMRNSLWIGISRSISDIKKSAASKEATSRTERDIKFNWVLPALLLVTVGVFFTYLYFSNNLLASFVATIVMLITGFFFAAVSGYLVGMIGSSNNPISGLTISTLVVAAVLIVALGITEQEGGVTTVLAVAAVICVSSAVAGEMLQDLKVGHILGGTPWRMQVGDIIGVAIAASVMFLPLLFLHVGDVNQGGLGLGGENYPAPQAGLMALLAKGIVGGEMAWPLVIVGMLMAVAMILIQVKSPMLVSVGMYLPLQTTFAIFVGGIIRWITDRLSDRRKHNASQKARVENIGILLAAGFIAGEALVGLLEGALAFFEVPMLWIFGIMPDPIPAVPPVILNAIKTPFWPGLIVLFILGYIMVKYPLKNAGKPDEPAPPSAGH